MRHSPPALTFFVENNFSSSANLLTHNEVLPVKKEQPQKQPQKQPAKPPRIATVDALRGIALLGIVAVHFRQLFVSGGLPESVSNTWATGPINSLVIKLVDALLVNKFYSLFSLLFGLGFTLMISRMREKSSVFYWRFTRRQFVLGLIGILHFLNWQGDILFVYAILGLSLILFYQVPNKIILVLAILLTLNIPGNIIWTLTYWNAPMPAFHSPSDYYLLEHGSYYQNILDNLRQFGHVGGAYSIGRLVKTMGFLLFGLYAGRRRLFEAGATNTWLLYKAVISALGILLVTKVMSVGLTHFCSDLQHQTELVKSLFRVIYNSRDMLVTLIYVAGLTLLFQSRTGQRLAVPLATTGQMALTNYLFQTGAATLLLCGYGMGLLGHIPVWVAVSLSIPLFALQVWLSTQWLARFRYGPVEWVWRCLTYGAWQPLRRLPQS